MSKLTLQQERQLLRAFQRTMSDIKDGAVLAQLQTAIERNDFDAVLTVLGMDRAAFAPIEDGIAAAYKAGGDKVAAQIKRVPVPQVGAVVFRFNVRDPKAEQWLLNRSSDLVTEMLDGQREVIQASLARGMILGNNPRTTALDLVGRINPLTKARTGGVVGLTTQQQQWVYDMASSLSGPNVGILIKPDGTRVPKFWIDEKGNLASAYALRDKRFDSMIKKAIESGEPLSQANIDKAVTQMQNRALRYRGETIARNESLNALRAGQHASIEQAVELGEVESQDVLKFWDASGDSRTREDHVEMEQKYADGIPIDEPFVFPDGTEAMFPGDSSLGASPEQVISCRCVSRTEINFLGRQVRIEGV
jgi:hypothetical protein